MNIMKNAITQKYNFCSVEIEAELNKLQFELEATATVQAKHDAQQQSGILTEALYEIRLLRSIILPKVQSSINLIREKLLVAAKVVGVQQLEIVSRKKIEKARTDINEKELAIIEVCKHSQVSSMPTEKIRLKKLVNIGGLLIAATDAVIAYGSFRAGSYSTIQAGSMALATFGLIFFATTLITPWIQSSKTKPAKVFKSVGICGLVFLAFLGIAMLRAEGLNSVIEVTVDSLNYNPAQSHHSAMPILFISYGLFLCMFFIHQFYWQNDEEKQKGHELKLQYQNVARLKKEIEDLHKEIKQTENELLENKNEVRKLFDYYHKLVLKAENIGMVATGIYKRTFSLYCSNIPDFFHVEQRISYDKGITFFNPEK
jgi:hypothetical protein